MIGFIVGFIISHCLFKKELCKINEKWENAIKQIKNNSAIERVEYQAEIQTKVLECFEVCLDEKMNMKEFIETYVNQNYNFDSNRYLRDITEIEKKLKS